MAVTYHYYLERENYEVLKSHRNTSSYFKVSEFTRINYHLQRTICINVSLYCWFPVISHF